MAWFCNHYECARCGHEWTDEWSCTVDDDCPSCGARHMSPVEYEDLTAIIEERGKLFVVLKSPDSAGHTPDYQFVAMFGSRRHAEAHLNWPVSS